MPFAFLEVLKKATGANWTPNVKLCALCQFCGSRDVVDFQCDKATAVLVLKYRACVKCVERITEAQRPSVPPGRHPDCDVTHPLVLQCRKCCDFFPLSWTVLNGGFYVGNCGHPWSS